MARDQTRPKPPSTRRDPRRDLPGGSVTLTVNLDGSEVECEVVTVSSNGLAFRLDTDRNVEVGKKLAGVSVLSETWEAAGDLITRDSRPAEGGGNKISCLFFPSSPREAAAWMNFTEPSKARLVAQNWCLQVRCATCQRAMYMLDRNGHDLQCTECGQQYDFGERLGLRQVEDLFQTARQMALDLSIDLASSVAVHLGIMTLGQIGDFLGVNVALEPSTPAASGSRKTNIDPAFRPAVEAGLLTHAQAVQRGRRESYVNRLIAAHRISFADACDVADNRDSLVNVIRKRNAGQTIPVQRGRPAVSTSTWLALAATAVAAVLFVLHTRNEAQPQVEAPQAQARAEERPSTSGSNAGFVTPSAAAPNTTPLGVEVLTDAQGWSTRIEARRPEDVLQAYCDHPGLNPLGLATGPIPNDSAWLGVFETLNDLGATHTIAIRKDRATGRWIAGNGETRIPVASPDRSKLGQFHDLVANRSRR